jgi:hypothetical protein
LSATEILSNRKRAAISTIFLGMKSLGGCKCLQLVAKIISLDNIRLRARASQVRKGLSHNIAIEEETND